jgi:two-component system cell cycle response regulator
MSTVSATEEVVDHSVPRILVVDDSPVVRKVVAGILAGPELRAQVMEASNGLAAARMAMATELDCVLCDMHMPDTDGLFFLRTVRAYHTRTSLPVLLLTSMDHVVDKVAGFRAGASDYVTKPFEPEELLARVVTHVTLARAVRNMTRQANTDALTGLANRRAFMDLLHSEHSRTLRSRDPYGALMCDIDRFKSINDTLGHAMGDRVLISVAKVIRASLRNHDVPGRLEGEEFAVLLPGANLAACQVVGERIRNAVASTAHGDLPKGSVTISIGAAAHTADTPYAPQNLMEQADRCLYSAKNSGRNRVVCTLGIMAVEAAGGPVEAPSKVEPGTVPAELAAGRVA